PERQPGGRRQYQCDGQRHGFGGELEPSQSLEASSASGKYAFIIACITARIGMTLAHKSSQRSGRSRILETACPMRFPPKATRFHLNESGLPCTMLFSSAVSSWPLTRGSLFHFR